YVQTKKLPFIVIGKGSNALFDDLGFDGLVILNKIDFLTCEEGELYSNNLNNLNIHVGAGYSFSLLGAQMARKGWGGLEFASGIPGSVGGAIFMNAGAKGGETWNPLVSIGIVDLEGNYQEKEKGEFSYDYRFSSFQKNLLTIVSATFALQRSEGARQRQLEILHERLKSQPYKEHNVGCIFRNPIGASAGALIDQCGLKGFSVGGAEVSTLHANFINNKGNATAREVLLLIEHVQAVVKEKTGKELILEVKKIPYQLEK
ncbi:MAG: UDP-N-acetylmuramate dehydrogenase, partial [Simkania negevensis]|nr:UDP-N-acetylmuramate dehydrogenase [Simkania negevensis]